MLAVFDDKARNTTLNICISHCWIVSSGATLPCTIFLDGHNYKLEVVEEQQENSVRKDIYKKLGAKTRNAIAVGLAVNVKLFME